MPMGVEPLVVSDFDGHMTDDEAGIQPFRERHLELFSARTEVSASEVEPIFTVAEEEVDKDPTHGLEDKGKIMSPIGVYSKITRATEVVLDQLGRLKDPEERKTFLDKLYHDSYPSARTVFRPYAADYLRRLSEVARVIIVTSSKADAVLKRLKLLEGAPQVPVVGNARKKEYEEGLSVPQKEILIPGFRAIQTRRGAYYKVLKEIGALNTDRKRVTVAGDNFELDLSLPFVLGMKVALLDKGDPRKRYEAAFLSKQQNAIVGTTLEELTDKIIEIITQ
jgi:hypothetical protein